MKNFNTLLFLILTTISGSILCAQVPVTYPFGTNNTGVILNIASVADTNFVGSTGDSIFCLDANYNPKWKKGYGHLTQDNIIYDFNGTIHKASPFASSGTAMYVGGNIGDTVAVTKYSFQGNLLWTVHIASHRQASPFSKDTLRNIITMDNGDVIAVGNAANDTNSVSFMARINPAGTVLWDIALPMFFYNPTPTFGIENGEQVVTQLADGSLVTATHQRGNYQIVKVDATGNILWSQSHYTNLQNLGAYDIIETDNNSILLCTQASLMVFDDTGNLTNTIPFPGSGFGFFMTDIMQKADGNYIVTCQQISGCGTGCEQPYLWEFSPALQTIDLYTLPIVEPWVAPSRMVQTIELTNGDIVTCGGYAGSQTVHGEALFINSFQPPIQNNYLHVNFFLDTNKDCVQQPGEAGSPNWIVNAFVNGGIGFYGMVSGPDGVAFNNVSNDSILLEATHLAPYYTLPVCSSFPLDTNFSALSAGDTLFLDVPVHLLDSCIHLVTYLNISTVRPCSTATINISYCNQGSMTANNTYAEVEIPSMLSITGSSIPGTLISGNTYSFPTGQLQSGQCGAFQIQTTVSCNAIAGQAVCVDAHLFPDSTCLSPAMAARWDGSDLRVKGTCLNGDSVQFRVDNVGSGDMSTAMPIIIIEDNVMLSNGIINLGSGTFDITTLPSDGSTYTMRVENTPGHPFSPFQIASVEGCVPAGDTTFSKGYVLQYAQKNTLPFVAHVCKTVVTSFDPNNKEVQPQGIDLQHYTNNGQRLNYRINFQNIGTDTAFNVYILDTLSEHLEISSFQVDMASHAFNASFPDTNVVRFDFPNIHLPDSNTNEPASHGFVNYSINLKPGLPEGTEVTNRAGIYFDSNAVVLTNTTLNTIVADYTTYLILSVEEELLTNNKLTLYPNPTNGDINLRFDSPPSSAVTFSIYDLSGKTVRNYELSPAQENHINNPQLQPGTYLFKVKLQDGQYINGKIMVYE